ncbi:hypothetical protein [Streptomyces orinoci]|uniref:Secreted protein n=1 Tax=Streptomyces orinoci TaxID=67339 RepID=A0ABV3K4U5_STRON|nr:hypothetical protein [Streptomyces orinoci]
MRGSQSGSAAQLVRIILDSAGRPGGGGEARGREREVRAVLEEARPARTAAARIAAAGGADERVAGRLRELVERHLGGHAERWRLLHQALAGHRGTLPELLADLPRQASAAASGAARSPVPRSVHATLGLLMEYARPEHTVSGLAALPDRTVEGLLAGGTLPGPGLIDAVTKYGDSRARTALAGHPRLDTRVLARLLTVGDARVGAAVYRNPRATPSLRRTLVHRLDSVPLDRTLRDELTRPGRELPRTWLTPLLGSGEPQLVTRALSAGVRGVAQQYALVRVWERTGPEAVRGMLDDPSVTRQLSRRVITTLTNALAEANDPDGALRRLREQCEPYQDPGRLPNLLATTRGTSSLRDLLSEPYVHDLRLLSEAHAKSPFMPAACEELARHEEADDAQRLAFRLSVLNDPWRKDGRRAGNITPPERRLAEEVLDDDAAWWAEGVIRAGLLDPVQLVRIARPAARAMAALVQLAEGGLLDETAVAELRSLTDTHLGTRPETWTALDCLLPDFTGTVRELITEAGTATPADPGTSAEAGSGEAESEEAPPRMGAALQEPNEPPSAPRLPHERAALAAIDLLRSLAPADAPLTTDPGILSFLAHSDRYETPGLVTPQWLVQACASQGVTPPEGGSWHTAPTRRDVWANPPESWGSSATLLEHAYTQGILPAEELLALLPARRMLLLPHDWCRFAFPGAWRAALARLLRTELGTDPDAWLQLAETAWRSAGQPGTGPGAGGPSWLELLSLPVDRPLREPATSAFTPRPRTPDEALKLLERGNHLWVWPIGTLLCLADAEVIDAVLPRLGPDGPWLLAAYLLRHDHTPRPVFNRLLADRDPQALRILAAQSRWLDHGLVERLAELDDADVDLSLLRHTGGNPSLARRIVARTRRPAAGTSPVAARVLAELRADPSSAPIGGLHWLCSAEPDLIEEILIRQGSQLTLVHQILGCLHLLQYGGAGRLAALLGREPLGQAATGLCAKALDSKDPAVVLRARLDRELAPAKLVKKLRRAQAPWQAVSAVAAIPVGVDWEALEAAHREEPLPHWEQLINLPDVPAELRLRHPALVREPGPNGLPQGGELTRARARHGLAGLYHCAPVTQLDGLLNSGILTGSHLLHQAAPAAQLLAYLNSAARRTDAPAEADAALAELAGLVRSCLGSDAEAWERVVRRLTGRDPDWDSMSTVAMLLADGDSAALSDPSSRGRA